MNGIINKSENKPYRGRFAPSPTGELHFGSLVAALASYLDAKANQGQWLIRIEDVDSQRSHDYYARSIIDTLSAHGLLPDEEICYQSHRRDSYEKALQALKRICYPCYCTRTQSRKNAQIGALGYIYPRYCYSLTNHPEEKANQRLYLGNHHVEFEDHIQGICHYQLDSQIGDPILQRKNQDIAYALAVVVDDAWQSITHVVRGMDLLAASSIQIYIQQQLNYPTIQYAHIPLILDKQQRKLSKQNHAPAIDNKRAAQNLMLALKFLNQDIQMIDQAESVSEILDFAIEHWDISRINNI